MFIAIDGDNIGSEIERLMILNEQKSLYDYSLAISRSIEFIKSKLLAEGGELILCGGDSILVKIGSITPHILSNVFFVENHSCSFSVGLGDSIPEAYLALKVAKSSGKRCWINYKELSKINRIGT